MNLKGLSELLGLSQTTVSRALNGFPEVSETTRKRVLAAAREHGYRANARARGLATGKARVIGHVIPVSDSHEMVNPIFGDFISGAARTYASMGYELMLTLVEDSAADHTYREIAGRGSVDGVILHMPRRNDWRIALLTEIGMPFVVHGRASDCGIPYSFVDIDNYGAFARSTAYLIGLGHSRIGYLGGREGLDFSDQRRLAFETEMTKAGLSCPETFQASSEMTEQSGFCAVNRMMAQPDSPTAFLCSSMTQAMGAQRALYEHGLRPGRDVSIVTHDDMLSYLRNGEEKPIFTASQSSIKEAGRRCAEILLNRIANPGAEHQSVVLESELVFGNSSGPCPG